MLKILLSQVKQYKRDSLLTPVFTTLESIMELIIPLLMARIIDEGINEGNLSAVYRYGALMLLAAAVSLTMGILAGRHAARASSGFACNLREAMYRNIQRYSFSNIDKYSTAGLVTRLTTDVTNLQNAYQMIIRMCVRAPVMLIFALIMAFSISARLSMIFVAAIAFLGLCLGFIVAHAMGAFEKVFRKYDELNAGVQENVTAIRVVKSFVRESFETEKFQNAVQNMYTSLMMLSMIFVMVTMSIASMRRIAQVLEEEPDIQAPSAPVNQVADGSISFEQVSFSYRPGAAEPVLQDIDLKIRSGETIGIIGGTGSAKTSLVALISRLYDVTQGTVKVGGRDVREYDLETLRNQVAVVLQKNVLFSGTVLENLRWGDPNATEEECRQACRVACADEFISRLPDGYQARVERDGANFSGGQKQRLCIARALLKKPKVLILDDSTSAVDTATDAQIRQALRQELGETTKLIIAQRISSVQDADRILVLDNGRINGIGTHEELMASNKIYREVYESQMKAGGDFDEKAG